MTFTGGSGWDIIRAYLEDIRRAGAFRSKTASQRAACIDADALALPATGWRLVRKNLGTIIEYGIQEGILEPKEEKSSVTQRVLEGAKQHAADREKKAAESITKGGDVDLPVTDVSIIHQAIPFLPVPLAVFCLLCNIFAPGVGTILSGVLQICFGQPRLQTKGFRRLQSLFINIIVGICQIGTITFMLVGWFWSIAWGAILLTHSFQYREAKSHKRQAQVATVALEALTKDTLLRRREVSNLVKKDIKDMEKIVKKPKDRKTLMQRAIKIKSQVSDTSPIENPQLAVVEDVDERAIDETAMKEPPEPKSKELDGKSVKFDEPSLNNGKENNTDV